MIIGANKNRMKKKNKYKFVEKNNKTNNANINK